METKYNIVDFSIKKANKEGNIVARRGGMDSSAKAVKEWHYFKDAARRCKLVYVMEQGAMAFVQDNGRISDMMPHHDDLVVLEPIKESILYGRLFMYETQDDALLCRNNVSITKVKVTISDGDFMKVEKTAWPE